MVEKILAIQNAPGEHLGYFANIMEDHGVPFEYSSPSPLPSLRNFSHIIVLGGPMGVYESHKYTYLRGEIRYIRRAFFKGIPVLGVCLGAQLMASSLGAQVFPGEKEEMGWHPIMLTEAGKKDRVMGALPSVFTAFHWHGDTFTMPRNARHLAYSAMYENQSFNRYHSYALQFHLEVTEEMVEKWTLELHENQRRKILMNNEKNISDLNYLAEKFLKSWLGL
jgi:GMP synthase-like glutamine amidotransferase